MNFTIFVPAQQNIHPCHPLTLGCDKQGTGRRLPSRQRTQNPHQNNCETPIESAVVEGAYFSLFV